MIDFACKEFALDEVVKCALGLSKADFKVLQKFTSEAWFTTEELAHSLNLNITTVQRAVKKLHEKGLIDRKQKNLLTGGYEFQYSLQERKIISKIVLSTLQGWVKKVDANLERWEHDRHH